MEKVNALINDKEYTLLVAKTDEEKEKGLSDTESIPEDGMLFDFSDDPQDELTFNTRKMKYPIDIIFINSDYEVAATATSDPGPDGLVTCIADDGEKLIYVVELKAGSLIEIGEEFEIIESDSDEMYMLDENGKPIYTIKSGARIFSRIHTRKLIRSAKKARKSKDDKDYKKLGKLMFKILDIQENQEEDFIEFEKDEN